MFYVDARLKKIQIVREEKRNKSMFILNQVL